MLIQTKFEMHAHDCEVTSRLAQNDVKWRFAVVFVWTDGLKLTEDSFWVSENIFWSDKTLHSSMDRNNGGLGADCSTGSL